MTLLHVITIVLVLVGSILPELLAGEQKKRQL